MTRAQCSREGEALASDPVLALKNEFAHVRVSLDRSANGPRLRIEDVRTGTTDYFDPLEVESFARCRGPALAQLLDPSRGRWAGDGSDVDEAEADGDK